jgi:cytochrome P450
VAFSDPTAVKSIHKMGSGFLKSQLYAKLQLTGTLLCIIPSKDHAARRKHFSSAFTQRNLIEWDQVILKKVGYMIANMKTASPRESVDILTFFTHMATDIIGELCLGESFKSYTDEEVRLNVPIWMTP